jgi:hypothetical protein
MRTLVALNIQGHSVQPQLDFSSIQTNSRCMASNYKAGKTSYYLKNLERRECLHS